MHKNTFSTIQTVLHYLQMVKVEVALPDSAAYPRLWFGSQYHIQAKTVKPKEIFKITSTLTSEKS